MKTKLLPLSRAPGYTTIGVQAFDLDEAGNDKPLESEVESWQLDRVLQRLKGLSRMSTGASRDCRGELRARGSAVAGVDLNIEVVETVDDRDRKKAFMLHLGHQEARALALQLLVASMENKEHLNRELDEARKKLVELETINENFNQD